MSGRRALKKNTYLVRRIGLALALLAVIGGVVGYINRGQLQGIYNQILGRDFSGPGTGSASLVISSGETGVQVAANLAKLGVVKNADVVYRLILSENMLFYPGTYELKKEMSSQQALDAIKDPASLRVNRVTIKEGLRIGTVLQQLSDATGLPLVKFQTAAKDLSGIGVPSNEIV